MTVINNTLICFISSKMKWNDCLSYQFFPFEPLAKEENLSSIERSLKKKIERDRNIILVFSHLFDFYYKIHD